MYESSEPSQLDRELRELRARAYGPHPDIQDDPQALARLEELESARLGAREPVEVGAAMSHDPVQLTSETAVVVEAPVPPASVAAIDVAAPAPFWKKAAATPTRRVWLIVGALLVVLGGWYAVSWFVAPPPEATLQPTGVEADGATLGAVSYAPLAEVDTSTLRGYESYRGLQPWVGEGAQGSRCLLLIDGSTLWGVRCAPPEAELTIDIGVFPPDFVGAYTEGLQDGTVIRFKVHEDTVETYLYPAPSTG
jgi:hypothetical protein